MEPSPQKKLKSTEKDDVIDQNCTLSEEDIKRIRDAKAKSPRTSISALASILNLNAADVKLALKTVRKKIEYSSDNDDNTSKSSKAESLSAPPTPKLPSFDSFDELLHFDSSHSSYVNFPKPGTSNYQSDEDDNDNDFEDQIKIEHDASVKPTDHITSREKLIDVVGSYIAENDKQLVKKNDKIEKLQKELDDVTYKNTGLATANKNLKEELERSNNQVAELNRTNAELKRALDAGGTVLANETGAKCIRCREVMAFQFRELAFCSIECVRTIALKLKGAELLLAASVPLQQTEN